MRRLMAVLGSALFLVLAPGAVAGLAPWWISRCRFEPVESGIARLGIRIAGGVLAMLGAIGLLDSFVRFAVKGLGTPAPVFPTRHLVVSGLYRYVRNPMYIAVLALIIGQGLIFANLRVLAYGAVVRMGFHFFVVAYEEPALRAAFGAEYEAYCRAVSRWIPRRAA